jgi:hypothetical protein
MRVDIIEIGIISIIAIVVIGGISRALISVIMKYRKSKYNNV